MRVLSVLDSCPREALALEVTTSLPSAAVIRVLAHMIDDRGQPGEIVMDTGSELTRRRLEQWTSERGIQLRVIEPGTPVPNARIERCNGRLRDACRNQHWCTSLAHAHQRIEDWRRDDHQVRPQSSLGDRTPKEVRQPCIRLFDSFDLARVSA